MLVLFVVFNVWLSSGVYWYGEAWFVWCLVCGVMVWSCMKRGDLCMVCGAWCAVAGGCDVARCVAYGMVCGVWCVLSCEV